MRIEHKRNPALVMIVLIGLSCAGGPPQDAGLTDITPQMLDRAGRELLREGRLTEAAERFRAALALDEDYAPALEGLGLVALEEDRRSDAEDYFLQGLRKDPGFARAYVGLGRLEAAGENYQAAIDDYKRAIELDNELAEAHYHLARAYEQMGRYSLAEEYYKKTLDRDPNHSRAREDWMALADRRSPPDEMPAEYFLIVKNPVVSRAELAVLLARQLPLETLCRGDEITEPPNDISGHWAAEYIARVVSCRLMTADQDTAFRPRQPVLRRDCARIAADIILRFGARKQAGSGPGAGATPIIRDVPADDRDLEAIQMVISRGIMELRKDGSFEPDREVNGYRATKIVQALRETLSSSDPLNRP